MPLSFNQSFLQIFFFEKFLLLFGNFLFPVLEYFFGLVLIDCLPINLHFGLSVCLSVYSSISQSVCRSIRLSVNPSVGLSVCRSICLSVYLSVDLSVCRFVCHSQSLAIFVPHHLPPNTRLCLTTGPSPLKPK